MRLSSAHNGGADVEGGGEGKHLASIEKSLGWCPLPKVKLSSWDPDDEKQWKVEGGEKIATRNLLISMPNLFACFGVWLSWSIIVVKMQQMHDIDPNVYSFPDWGNPDEEYHKFLLSAIPTVAGISGGIMRICNAFLTHISGGRNVVYSNSVLLMVPMIMAAAGLGDPNVPYSYVLAMAIFSGIGGGGFASSMSNMSFLYPKTQQGYSLGFNGGLGNLGVSMSQLLLPQTMAWSAGKAPLSNLTDGWPEHAGWFWWPICLVSAICSFMWMSNNPNHGNHSYYSSANKLFCSSDTFWSHIYFYWTTFTGLFAALLTTSLLIGSREIHFFTTAGGEVMLRFLLVVFAIVVEHLICYFGSPLPCKRNIRDQARIFKDKHTYLMTILYIMSFGSFIGFSGAFPKLIQDLFGYIKVDGCVIDDVFHEHGTPQHCVASGGIWETRELINPNAPDVFRYSWLGACFGSLIRPFGGILADRYGGANVTMLLIIWCVIATICTAILVQKIYADPTPEPLFGWFVFMFINLFFTVGAMNGTTFGTIGVMFEKDLAGTVLGWSSAIASFGAFFIPSMFQVAMKYEAAETVLYGLAAFYFVCGCINYYYYFRRGCERPGV
ncbi:Nitrate/nitrite transporter NarU [Seminavis robusta]|uniref:Nitrate/nitrite transporter NarU n=1 Tax=Seminavis robusta TaxID=568900 RepID=A0A9N8EFC1_9STRA|nr:Nitrate/nitrite transporter NarU [Seminavis robusta]|eukprot:Sro1070_g237730.1 Nitrate/nitrite transporter NarU (608) ;mRNA; f:11704-13527